MPSLSGLMPLARGGSTDGHDFDRAEMLLHTLRKGAAPGTFDRFAIVTPLEDVAAARDRFCRFPDFPIDVLADVEVAPELKVHNNLTGWTKQQLVKICYGARSGFDVMMAIDADLICLAPFSKETLLPNGRALIDSPEPHWQRPWYWKASARYLGTPLPDFPETIGGTPVLMARSVMQRLTARLASGAHRGDWFRRLVTPLKPLAPHQLHPKYRERYRWSEYTLYFLTAWSEGMLDDIHHRTEQRGDPLRLLSKESLFGGVTDLDEWQAPNIAAKTDPALFAVIQSNTRIPPETVKAKLQSWGLRWSEDLP